MQSVFLIMIPKYNHAIKFFNHGSEEHFPSEILFCSPIYSSTILPYFYLISHTVQE